MEGVINMEVKTWGAEIPVKIPKYIRVFSFQRKPVIDAILTKGVYYFDLDDECNNQGFLCVQRIDKMHFYQRELSLKENIFPLFTFARLGGIYPVSIQTLRVLWSELMGYYGLRETNYLIEMLIPISEGKLGTIDGPCKTVDNLSPTGENLEFVVSCFKKEWVKEIYSISSDSTYGTRTLKPIMKQHKDVLIQSPIKFSGDEYAEDDYSKFCHTAPIDGITIAENCAFLTDEDAVDFLTKCFPKEIADIKGYEPNPSLVDYLEMLSDRVYKIYSK